MKNNWKAWFLILILTGGAFWYGSQDDHALLKKVYPPHPTSEPDLRVLPGMKARVDGMDLSLLNAWRIARPKESFDLGILEVKFEGTGECNDMDEDNLPTGWCNFQRNNFSLVDSQGKKQPISPAVMKFLHGMKYVQLAPSRELNKLTSESGQLYFLLDKNVKDFTLVYVSQGGGDGIKIRVMPKLYDWNDASQQLTTTPWPERKVLED